MKKKGKRYIEKIKVIAEADIRCGNKEKLKKLIPTLIEKEEYEDCEGIKQALLAINTNDKMRQTELVPVFVDQIPETVKMGLLYISYKYGVAIHLCPCGCGGKVVCDLKPNWENGWDIKDNGGLITLRPSIGNWNGEHPYHAHYYITDNKIEWL